MTLDVLDELTLARLARVEVWVSLYWDEPYNTEGEFTLEVRPTEENLSLLREGRWLRRSDSDVPMRICHRSNENQDSNLVVTGFPGTWIFTKRACTSIVKNENAEAAMRRQVSAMQPWPKLELGTLVGFDTTYTAQTSGGSIMDYLMTIGAACDLGFRVRLAGKNADKKLLEQLRTGSIELTIDAEGLSPGDVAYCTIPELGYKATVRVADVITQSQSDSTTRTVRLGTPVWRKLKEMIF